VFFFRVEDPSEATMAELDRPPQRRESLRIVSVERPGWDVDPGWAPEAGEDVWCVDGVAEVMRVLGRTSDGSRLLELRLLSRPKPPYFAAASNVLRRRKGEHPGFADAAQAPLGLAKPQDLL
jgi:hypothetical protein